MLEPWHALFYFSLGIPTVIFGLYGAILLYYGKLKRNEQVETRKGTKEAVFEPFVSIVVPTHNEETIIRKKIQTLLDSDYSHERTEIIFVDDSDDSTPEIIEDYSKRFTNIRLIKFAERVGYSPSMIAGCKAAKGEIVVLSDAGSFLDAKGVSSLVSNFKVKNVGVATGKDVILNVDEAVGKSENLYQKIRNFLRTAETSMDSTFYIKGEATAVRRDLIKDLQECSETFDTTVGLFVRQKGYRVVYDPNVKFYEYAPLTHSDRVKQKTIRAANLIKVLFRFRHLMFKTKYGKYGSVVLPMHFTMLVIAPVAIIFALMALIVLTFLDPVFAAIAWSALGVILVSLLVFSKHLIITFFEFEYSLLKGLYQVLFTKKEHDKIDKAISTRRTQ